MNRFASPLSLIVAAILGGLVSQGISRWMPEARAQEGRLKVQEEVRAKKVVIVNADDKPQVVISGAPTGAGSIVLYGSDDRTIARLEVEAETGVGVLSLWDKDLAKGNCAVLRPRVLSFSEGSGKDMKARVKLGVYLDKETRLTMSGFPSVILEDEDSKVRGVFGTDLEALRTGDKTKTAPSSLNLFDKEGKVIWKAP